MRKAAASLRAMKRPWQIAGGAVAAIALAAQTAAPARAQDALRPWTLASCLERLGDDRWLHRPPSPGERAFQFSSFDRRSQEGPAAPGAWYANDDRGKYLRVEERDGRREHVLAECDGPGIVTRIWSANPTGTLWVDVDGERVLAVDFLSLLSGREPGLGEPLCGMRARGGNCALPIPFSRSLKVSASAGDLYYHVNVLQLAKGEQAVGLAKGQLADEQPRLLAAAAALADPRKGSAVRTGPASDVEIPAGRVVTGFSLLVPPVGHDVDLGQSLRNCLLVVRAGGEETVRVPALDFFAGGADWRPHAGRWLQIDADGAAHCRFRMPMPDGGSIRIVDEDPDDGFAPAIFGVQFDEAPAQADDLLFRASYRQRAGFASRPFHDYCVLDASGAPGRFVGCSLLVKNPHRAWWGEGDEKFYVDGEQFPSTFGTGTEDYFGYAWCDTTLFQSALHGQTQCDGPNNYGFTAVHRLHLLDQAPFQRSFRFDLEVWHWVEELRMDYASVAYWYGKKGAVDGAPPVPPVSERGLGRLPPPPVRVVQGAIEAESLRVLSCSKGRTTVQETWFIPEICSRDAQLWWMDGDGGAELQLAVPVPASGRYRIRAAFVKAGDYGIVQCRLGGEDLGPALDLYSGEIQGTGALDLGERELVAGEATLTLRLLGRNPAAQPRYMVGLDYLLLERLP